MQCSGELGVSSITRSICDVEREGVGERVFTTVQPVHFFLLWGTVREIMVMVHVLVEAFLEERD